MGCERAYVSLQSKAFFTREFHPDSIIAKEAQRIRKNDQICPAGKKQKSHLGIKIL